MPFLSHFLTLKSRNRTGSGKTPPEPKAGEWIPPKDFEHIVRLTPLIAIDLIVRSPDGRVLVGLRKNEPARNMFFVPGSRITKNESLAAAFKRISREELGVEMRLADASFRGVYEHFYPTNRFGKAGFGTHYITLGYELNQPLDTAALPRDQHNDYAWMTEAELVGSPNVHPNTKAYFLKQSR